MQKGCVAARVECRSSSTSCCGEERAQAIGDVVLEIGRRLARKEVSIEVALARPLALRIASGS
jgi:hypothetical protein